MDSHTATRRTPDHFQHGHWNRGHCYNGVGLQDLQRCCTQTTHLLSVWYKPSSPQGCGSVQRKAHERPRTSTETIYIVCNQKTNLLGLPAITSLQLASRVDSTNTQQLSEVDPRERFPTLFQGLGTLGQEYFIKLKDGAHPYALYIQEHANPSPDQGQGRVQPYRAGWSDLPN